MSIHALPQTAVRAIGSSQTLTDPASVVKELIDNAIDARASSVSVEISSNTLDVIQVRDNGHGIAPSDRPLVARRYCTSKIKNEKDLRTIGGSFLGFRGEALSSAAEMSGGIVITTRIEGEDIATALKINPGGEIEAQDRASHPVGTTVRITDFLSHHPVRKQVALKGTVKTISKMKQILQSYAFARPTIRLSFRVLKAKNDRDNWTYAPKAGADAEEATLKVIGKPCTTQCTWSEVESKGFEIRAYVPRIDADLSKISGAGQYLSVDGRPLTTSRGFSRQVVKIFRDSLKDAGMDLEGVKEPFMFMSICCPEASYDPNVEPAKDDVLFGDLELVIAAIRDLFNDTYPIAPSPQPVRVPSCMDQYEASENAIQTPVMNTDELLEERQPHQANAFKTNMYAMEEGDLELMASMAEEPARETSDVDEESGQGSSSKISSSNPWIMAKMNGQTGKLNLGHSEPLQPLTPARSVLDRMQASSSPVRPNASHLADLSLPTPRGSSPVLNMVDLPVPRSYTNQGAAPTTGRLSQVPVIEMSPSNMTQQRSRLPDDYDQQGLTIDQIPEAPPRRRGPPRRAQQGYINKPFKPPIDPERDAWFDMSEAENARPRRTRQQAGSSFSGQSPDRSQPTILSRPANNADIRSFVQPRASRRAVPDNNPSQSNETLEIPPMIDENTNPRPLHLRAPAQKRHRLASGDFVPASDLTMNPTSPPQSSPEPSPILPRPPHHPRPHRRIKAGERALVQVSGNSRPEESDTDPSYDPNPRPHTSGKRRGTTDGAGGGSGQKSSRTKSSQLPLEGVPQHLHMQNVVLHLPFSPSSSSPSSPTSSASTKAKITAGLEAASADATMLAWNQPAVEVASVFDSVADEECRAWSARMKSLLARVFPEGEMVGDIEGMVKGALRGRQGLTR